MRRLLICSSESSAGDGNPRLRMLQHERQWRWREKGEHSWQARTRTWGQQCYVGFKLQSTSTPQDTSILLKTFVASKRAISDLNRCGVGFIASMPTRSWMLFQRWRAPVLCLPCVLGTLCSSHFAPHLATNPLSFVTLFLSGIICLPPVVSLLFS